MSGAVQSCKEVTVTDAKWQNVDKISIACSSVGSKVYIKLDTKNFKEGDEIKVNIVDNTNNRTVIRENVAVKIRKEDNSDSIIAISEEIEVEKEWLFKELAIVVPEFTYEEDAERNICETKLSGLTGSKLSVVADYLDVRIKVLDVRSNKPVANAVVKSVKIIDESGNAELLKTEFDHKETKLGSVSESNTRSKLSIKALKSLLNKTDKEADSYDDKWKKAYKEYWNARTPDAKIEYPQQGIPKDNILDLIIRDYNDQVATDNNGILTIHIPSALLKDKSARIEIGFWNFPVVKESIVSGQGFCRNIDPVAGQAEDTHFIVSWGNGTQSTEWGGNFNWIASNPRQEPEEDGDNRAELKVSESLIIKDSAEEIFSIKPNLHSFIYTKDGDPHFILFAMQWCQPVWDEMDDPVVEYSGPRSNADVFVNRQYNDGQWIKDIRMHMVTRFSSGGYNPYGHYYGFYERKHGIYRIRDDANYRHSGVDLYSGSGGNLPVFATHGGKIEKGGSSTASSGHTARLRFVNGASEQPYFVYMHLASETPCNGQYVLAGQIIGTSGRTGFMNSDNPSHMHFELRDSTAKARPLDDIARTSILKKNTDFILTDAENTKLFQCNKYPLVLPCKCHYSPGSSAATGCTFSKTDVIKRCWAVQEFPFTQEILDGASNQEESQKNDTEQNKRIEYPSLFPPLSNRQVVRFICPHILHANANKMAQLQAKLRLLIENQEQVESYIPLSVHLRNFSYRINSAKKRTTSEVIDGQEGESTRNWVAALLKTYQQTLADDNENKTIAITDTAASISHAKKFIEKFVTGTASGDQFIEDAYMWFDNIDFSLPLIEPPRAIETPRMELPLLTPRDIQINIPTSPASSHDSHRS